MNQIQQNDIIKNEPKQNNIQIKTQKPIQSEQINVTNSEYLNIIKSQQKQQYKQQFEYFSGNTDQKNEQVQQQEQQSQIIWQTNSSTCKKWMEYSHLYMLIANQSQECELKIQKFFELCKQSKESINISLMNQYFYLFSYEKIQNPRLEPNSQKNYAEGKIFHFKTNPNPEVLKDIIVELELNEKKKCVVCKVFFEDLKFSIDAGDAFTNLCGMVKPYIDIVTFCMDNLQRYIFKTTFILDFKNEDILFQILKDMDKSIIVALYFFDYQFEHLRQQIYCLDDSEKMQQPFDMLQRIKLDMEEYENTFEEFYYQNIDRLQL